MMTVKAACSKSSQRFLLELLLVQLTTARAFESDVDNLQRFSPRVVVLRSEENSLNDSYPGRYYITRHQDQSVQTINDFDTPYRIIKDFNKPYEQQNFNNESVKSNINVTQDHISDNRRSYPSVKKYIEKKRVDESNQSFHIPVEIGFNQFQRYNEPNNQKLYHYGLSMKSQTNNVLPTGSRVRYDVRRLPTMLVRRSERQPSRYSTKNDLIASESSSSGYIRGFHGGTDGYDGGVKTFPPPSIIAKIGSKYRPPCHGPECHDHHKGIVKFWWKKVILPKSKKITGYSYDKSSNHGVGGGYSGGFGAFEHGVNTESGGLGGSAYGISDGGYGGSNIGGNGYVGNGGGGYVSNVNVGYGGGNISGNGYGGNYGGGYASNVNEGYGSGGYGGSNIGGNRY